MEGVWKSNVKAARRRVLSPDKSRSWCCSSFKLLLLRERRDVRECTSSGTSQLNSCSWEAHLPPQLPTVAGQVALKAAVASKLPPTNQASCSLNRRHRYQRPPACSFPTHNMMSCTSNKTCLRWHQTQHHLPTATALTSCMLYMHCDCVMHNKYVWYINKQRTKATPPASNFQPPTTNLKIPNKKQ